MNLRIFAKVGTDEKAAVNCSQNEVPQVNTLLGRRFGGEWVLVDQCHGLIECIHFTDGMIYKGFNPVIERYSPLLKQL